METVHVVIPVRGGSVGIPGKNLQLVDGVPLVVRQWRHVVDVMADLIDGGLVDEASTVTVATDDNQIAGVAQLHGADVRMRPPVPPEQTLSESMHLIIAEPDPDAVYAIVQATAVDMADDLYEALASFLNDLTLDSMVTATPVNHLTWSEDGLIGERVNRQQIRPHLWTENGLLHITRTYPNKQTGAFTDTGSVMIGAAHRIHECDVLDIDTPDDLEQARRATTRALIRIEARGGQTVGSGHVRRQLALAAQLGRHDIVFADHHLDAIHVELIRDAGYTTTSAPPGDVDLIIVDDPHVDPLYLHGLVAAEIPFLTFENEIDPDAINALLPGRYGGPDYFLPRPEFVGLPHRPPGGPIMVSFGGTDPHHMTERVVAELEELWPHLVSGTPGPIDLLTITPPLADRTLECPGVRVDSMAAAMWRSSVLITSQGRTVYEAALCGIPTISVAVNEREAGHLRLPGVTYLGHRLLVPEGAIAEAVAESLADPARCDVVDGKGAARVIALVEAKLAGL